MRKSVFAVALFVAPLAAAGTMPLPEGFDMTVAYNGSGQWRLSNPANDGNYTVSVNANGNWLISGTAAFAGTDWGYDLEVAPLTGSTNGPAIAFISSAFTVTNNNASPQNFVVTATQGALVFPGPTEILGSHSGNVGDNPSFGDGALLSTISGSSMYQAQIDGATVRTLFDDPFSVAAAPNLTNSYGPGSFGWEGGNPAVATSISIINEFTLSGNDNAGMTSTFVVRVPTPGAASLLGVFGVAALRRRR
ncbi:MAG: hypothetical protein KDA20_12710 [Phycisphaerales bacterium]|nr:hypothetical protein [Phycisphaerales bacterium]